MGGWGNTEHNTHNTQYDTIQQHCNLLSFGAASVGLGPPSKQTLPSTFRNRLRTSTGSRPADDIRLFFSSAQKGGACTSPPFQLECLPCVGVAPTCLSQPALNSWAAPVDHCLQKNHEITEHITGDLRKGQAAQAAVRRERKERGEHKRRSGGRCARGARTEGRQRGC